MLKIFAENFLLNLSGNPLRCDCWATELRAKVAGEDGGSSYSRMFRLSHHPLTCSSNNNNNNSSSTAVSLQQMAYSDLVCAADSCVPGCRCSLNRWGYIYNIYCIIYNISNMSRYYHLVTVDCSGAPLASLPDLDTVEVTPQQRLALNLSNTGLEDADLAMVAGASNYQKVE